jgi:hypothetical protein
LDGFDLLFGIWAAGIDDMQEQAGLASLLQSRFERGDQPVREFADEANGIAEKDSAPVFDVPLPRARVERGKKPVLHEHGSAGEPIH